MQVALELLEQRAEAGVTWREVAAAQRTGTGHGSASRILSDLHRTARVCRLLEQRDGCSVYVLPEHVRDRETRPYPHPPEPPLQAEDAAAMAGRVLGVIERWGLDASRSPAMAGLASDLRRAVNRPLPSDQPTLAVLP